MEVRSNKIAKINFNFLLQSFENSAIYVNIIKPIAKYSLYLGISPFTTKNGQIVLSRIRLVPSTILVLTNIALTIIYSTSFGETSDFTKAETIKFLTMFRDLGSTTMMVLNLFFSQMYFTKKLEQMRQVHEVDNQLKQMGCDLDIPNSVVQKHLILLMVLVNLIFNTCGEVFSAWVRCQDQILIFLVNWYPRLIIGIMNSTLNLIFLLIQTRFEMINNIITRGDVTSTTIKKLFNLHKILVKVVREINGIFAFQVLMCTSMNFVLLIGDLHTSIYIIFFDMFYQHHKIVLDMGKNCVTYVFDLFYLSKRASDLCNEANKTKILLVGLKIDIDQEEERNVVVTSVLKLMQNKLEITACRLFSIDNALLFSVLSNF
nr:PREDICTED: uncharacterized protein LOC107398839 [Tribolium castaneum]|eukprot:XP_015839845.1 PREDICTED: uncharacterized protein LOC107398839 [Tribolium castaneum]